MSASAMLKQLRRAGARRPRCLLGKYADAGVAVLENRKVLRNDLAHAVRHARRDRPSVRREGAVRRGLRELRASCIVQLETESFFG